MLSYLESLTMYQIDITLTICLLIGVIILTVICLTFWTAFNPLELTSIVKDTRELKQLDTIAAHDVHNSGFITKLLFRIFCRGAERYFP